MKVKAYHITAAVAAVFFLVFFLDSRPWAAATGFKALEYRMQDSILQADGETDPDIAIIGIDDASLQALGRWPWPRTVMAELVDRLSEAKPAVIGIDVSYSDVSQNPADDKALVEAVKKAGNVVLPVKGIFGKYAEGNGDIRALNLEESFGALKEAAASGHINNMLDSDNIVRNSLLEFTYDNRTIKSFDWMIARQFEKSSGKASGIREIPLDSLKRWHVAFYGEPGDYDHFSFSEVLRGTLPAEYFKNKIVLIGPYTEGMMDSYYTPLDRQQQMNGIEIHANIIQNLLNNNFKRQLPFLPGMLLILLAGTLAHFAFRRFSPAKGAISLFAFFAFYLLISRFTYNKGIILPLSYPLAIAAVVYLILLAYRYLEEYLERKRITGVFGRYVAPQIVEEILKGGEESLRLGGTRREISALFVDIRGFTPMSEKVQPEQVVEILNDYLNLTASSIFKFGGTLDKFIGDATMALFNAPLDLEDHAFRAVQTAWAMREGSEVLRKNLEEKYGQSVQFGIGINTGYAVVGNIGARFRMDYTAIGDTVNTAARLESNAKPGQILISQSTYELVKNRVAATSLGAIKVKGKEQGVPVYQLDGLLVEEKTETAMVPEKTGG